MEAKKAEEDLSMEEILQSIRAIIADDGEEGKTASAAVAPAAAPTAEKPTAPSDVLELTDMITEDGSVVNVKNGQPTGDILGQIDAALAPEVTPAPAPVPAPVAAEPSLPLGDAEALLSRSAETQAVSSLNKITKPGPDIPKHKLTPSPQFRSGMTVEDMVEDMIRPMLKEWLDENVPKVVERIVEREVQRLTRR